MNLIPLLALAAATVAVVIAVYTAIEARDRRLLFLTLLPLLLFAFGLYGRTLIVSLPLAGRLLWFAVNLTTAALIGWFSRVRRSGLEELHRREQETRRYEEELTQARADNESMRRLKTSFLANMNHEIRTPLTSVIGFSSVLLDEMSERHREPLLAIERSGRSALDSLDSVLDLTMLEAGAAELHLEPLNLTEEAELHAERITPSAAAKGVRLLIESQAPSIGAYVDRACLGRVLVRLLSNAVRETESGGRVSVRLGTSGDMSHIIISPVVETRSAAESAEGVAADPVGKTRSAAESAEDGGIPADDDLGVDLSLTRSLLELMDGTLRVERRQENDGSSYVVTLPAQPILEHKSVRQAGPPADFE